MESGLKPYIVMDPPDLEINPHKYRFPSGSVVTNLFIDHQAFQRLEKPAGWRTFYVVRDPKRLLVSWYLSNRYSHYPDSVISQWRSELMEMSDEDGMMYTIDRFDDVRKRVKSWVDEANQNDDIILARFEDLTAPGGVEAWRALFDRLGLAEVKTETIEKLLSFYDIKKLAPPEKGSASSKFEKYSLPKSRNYSTYITPKVESHLYDRYPNLMQDFGYS